MASGARRSRSERMGAQYLRTGHSAANGVAERAILTIGGLVRTAKTAVEENVLVGRGAGPRLMAWMVHHAAQLLNAISVRTDGLTTFRRLKGRKFGTLLAGFGECVWLREPPLEKVNKLNPRCVEARLPGFCLGSSRYIVVDFDGTFRVLRTVKRTRFEDRWMIASPSDPFWRTGRRITALVAGRLSVVVRAQGDTEEYRIRVEEKVKKTEVGKARLPSCGRPRG